MHNLLTNMNNYIYKLKEKGKLSPSKAKMKQFFQQYDVICKAVPIYEEMDGWETPVTGVRNYKELPVNAKKYLKRLERLLKVKIKYISVGSKRSEMIFL